MFLSPSVSYLILLSPERKKESCGAGVSVVLPQRPFAVFSRMPPVDHNQTHNSKEERKPEDQKRQTNEQTRMDVPDTPARAIVRRVKKKRKE